MNRLKVAHDLTLSISRDFDGLLVKLDRRRLLVHATQLRKQGGVNRLKVAHDRALPINRNFDGLLVKLDRRRLLVHATQLRKQSKETRLKVSTSSRCQHIAYVDNVVLDSVSGYRLGFGSQLEIRARKIKRSPKKFLSNDPSIARKA